MSTVRKSNQPVAILCADIHLSLRPPIARAEEPDWFAAMQRPLDELGRFAMQLRVPILCAGDVFDYWRSPPELINFALEHLPQMYAIPGQHDLPYHSMEEIEKSAFWTLVKVGRIIVPSPQPSAGVVGQWGHRLWGYSFGKPVYAGPKVNDGLGLRIALVHQYMWVEGRGYLNAPSECFAGSKRKEFRGYDVVVVGDNHTSFDTRIKFKDGEQVTIWNCGSLMRRTADQLNHHPQVGLLYANGEVKAEYLDVSTDCISRAEAGMVAGGPDLSRLFGELDQMQSTIPDFGDLLTRALDSVDARPGIRRAIQQAMEKQNEADLG